MDINLNQTFGKIPDKLLKIKWLLLVLFFLGTFFMLYGMFTKFSIDMSLETWFREDDPIKTSLNKFRQEFGSDDGVYVVYQPKDDNVFSVQSLSVLKQLHEKLVNARFNPENPNLNRVERIDSLINIRYQQHKNDSIVSRELVGKNLPKTDQEAQKIKQIALSEEDFKLAYFSQDFKYAGIRLKTNFGTILKNQIQNDPSDDFSIDFSVNETDELPEYEATEMEEYLGFMTELRQIIDQFPDFKFYFSGNAPMMEFAMNSMNQASMILGLMVVVTIVLLWILFNSFSAVIWPVVLIAASAVWSIGIFSWLDITLTNMVSLSFMLILAVGIADCVHVMSAYINYRNRGDSHRIAMSNAYYKTGKAILLTTITTMLGMSALLITDIPHIGVFGLMSALGVAMAFIFTILFLPLVLDIYHPMPKAKTIKFSAITLFLKNILEIIPQKVTQNRFKVIATYIALFAILIYGLTQVKVDTNFAKLAKEDSDIRIAIELIDKKMMGADNLEIFFDFNKEDALKEPKVLIAIDELAQELKNKYPQYVVKTFSLADLVKKTYKTFMNDDNSYYKIPADAKLTAQLLYLFDNSNPQDRRSLVNDDYSKTHISLMMRNAGSYEYTKFFQDARDLTREKFSKLNLNFPQSTWETTGSLTLMMELLDHISWAQVKSFIFALLMISLLLTITLGSVQSGVISIIPNLLPAFFTFGMLGLLAVALDSDTLLIVPVIIGIAVDDTIHFMSHYRDAWYKTGDVMLSIEKTVKEVGQAVVFTTLILGVGFFMLSFSDYLGLVKTGLFGSLAIFVALGTDLLLLPALLYWLKPDLGRRKYLRRIK